MSHRKVLLTSLGAIAAMLGLVAASVPLYRMYCRVTGYGGTPRVLAAAPDAPASDRVVVVRFDSSVAKGLNWRFQPEQNQIRVRLGEPALAVFSAANLASRPIVGTATFNVTPDKAGRFFNKVQCFCFTEQRLEPGQHADLPVSFWVDPALSEDVDTITLSYTFFEKGAP